VAAALANGLSIEQLGPRITDLVRLDYKPPEYGPRRIAGTIVAVDRFGNLITDVESDRMAFKSYALKAGDTTIGRLSTTYGGEGPFLIVGSSGCVEISVAGGSAAALLQLSRGDRVTVVPA
jgi:S-adenosylmethionine hydrolase